MPDAAAQVAAELDGRLDLVGVLSHDEQRDLSVLQIEALTDRDVGRKVAIGRAHAFGGARTPSDVIANRRAALEPHRRQPVGERAGANLRTGQILQERGVDAELF